MNDVVLSQAHRISNGDADLFQNIIGYNLVNTRSAKLRGKDLSIGEQINFMKNRTTELRSGIRNHFGNKGYHANDVYDKRLYYRGEVEKHSIHYSDQEGHDESPEKGKGDIAFQTSTKNPEDALLFQIDLERFLRSLSEIENLVFLMKLEGFKQYEIAHDLEIGPGKVRQVLLDVGRKCRGWFGLS